MALGGLGIGHKSKSRNPNGLQAISAYICTNLNCPKSDIKLVEDCGSNAELDHGICKCVDGFIGNGQNCEPESCPSGTKPNDDNSGCIPFVANDCDDTILCQDGAKCISGMCVCEGSDFYTLGLESPQCVTLESGCRDNLDCQSDQYCMIQESELNAPKKGVCMSLSEGIIQDDYLLSENVMGWYSALNWCKAHNKNLISLNTIDPLFDEKNFGQYRLCFGESDFKCFTFKLPKSLRPESFKPEYKVDDYYFWAKTSENHPFVIYTRNDFIADYLTYEHVFFDFYALCE